MYDGSHISFLLCDLGSGSGALNSSWFAKPPVDMLGCACLLKTPGHVHIKSEGEIVPPWRIRNRIKSGAGVLVLCLNVGVDPSDLHRPPLCGTLQCWTDPQERGFRSAAFAMESVGTSLLQQYSFWHPKSLSVLQLLPDPSLEALRSACLGASALSPNERLLFHYNGHGVPKPTSEGEIWVFNKTLTEYVPVSILSVFEWLKGHAETPVPTLFVLDCPHAARISKPLAQYRPISDILVLGAPDAPLSLHPDMPADILTSCLTTPIEMAVLFFLVFQRPPLFSQQKDRIPKVEGRAGDRNTPLGELNWIFTAITDMIAWDSLPLVLFHRLYRQDVLVAGIFRNYLLAERVFMALGTVGPVSHPTLPPMHNHPLWNSWDAALERLLLSQPQTFFTDHLEQFSMWIKLMQAEKKNLSHINGQPAQTLAANLRSNKQTNPRCSAVENHPCLVRLYRLLYHGGDLGLFPIVGKRNPYRYDYLPILLQILLSNEHREHAIQSLCRYFDLGDRCVWEALSVGLFPYLLRLIQSTLPDRNRLSCLLVYVLARICKVDSAVVSDLNGSGYNGRRDPPIYFFVSIAFGEGESQQDTIYGSAVSGSLYVLYRWLVWMDTDARKTGPSMLLSGLIARLGQWRGFDRCWGIVLLSQFVACAGEAHLAESAVECFLELSVGFSEFLDWVVGCCICIGIIRILCCAKEMSARIWSVLGSGEWTAAVEDVLGDQESPCSGNATPGSVFGIFEKDTGGIKAVFLMCFGILAIQLDQQESRMLGKRISEFLRRRHAFVLEACEGDSFAMFNRTFILFVSDLYFARVNTCMEDSGYGAFL